MGISSKEATAEANDKEHLAHMCSLISLPTNKNKFKPQKIWDGMFRLSEKMATSWPHSLSKLPSTNYSVIFRLKHYCFDTSPLLVLIHLCKQRFSCRVLRMFILSTTVHQHFLLLFPIRPSVLILKQLSSGFLHSCTIVVVIAFSLLGHTKDFISSSTSSTDLLGWYFSSGWR